MANKQVYNLSKPLPNLVENGVQLLESEGTVESKMLVVSWCRIDLDTYLSVKFNSEASNDICYGFSTRNYIL